MVTKNRTHEVGNNDTLTVGKKLVVSAGDQITLKTGKASVIMKKNGDITIKGKLINIQGSGNIVMKAKKILEN